MFIIRWVLDNDKVFIAVLLPVVSDKDAMLIIAYDKLHCTKVFIIRWILHNDISLMTGNRTAIITLSMCITHLMKNNVIYHKLMYLSIISSSLTTGNSFAINSLSLCSTHLMINTFVQCYLS